MLLVVKMNKEAFVPEIATSALPDMGPYMGQDMGEIPPLRVSDACRDSSTSAPDVSEGQNGRESIKVLVRIRPLLAQETGPVAVEVGHEGNVIRVNGSTPHRQLQCSYDAVFGPEVSQKGVFSHVRECTSAVLEGENSTIFAYGQTGSGKTYTMFGPDLDPLRDPPAGQGHGVIPLAVADLFARLVRGMTRTTSREWSAASTQTRSARSMIMCSTPSTVHTCYFPLWNKQSVLR